MTEFRFARPGDTPRIRELWEQGFGDEGPEYTDWYFNRVYQPQRTLCCLEGPLITACLQLAPYTLMLDGRPRRAAYIVGVVTDAAQRRQGYGRQLMAYALRQLYVSGYELALLYTDIPDFYEHLGFTHCYWQRLYSWPVDTPPQQPEEGWSEGEPDDRTIAHCAAIYNRMTRGWNGYISRTPENWRTFLQDPSNSGGGIWLGPDSYFLCLPEAGGFFLREIGFLDPPGLESALAQARWVARRQSFYSMSWAAPLSVELPEQEGKEQPFAMCRRLDLPVELEGRQAAAETLELFSATPRLNWINEYV